MNAFFPVQKLDGMLQSRQIQEEITGDTEYVILPFNRTQMSVRKAAHALMLMRTCGGGGRSQCPLTWLMK